MRGALLLLCLLPAVEPQAAAKSCLEAERALNALQVDLEILKQTKHCPIARDVRFKHVVATALHVLYNGSRPVQQSPLGRARAVRGHRHYARRLDH
jgi:hypothetical protein